jgi:outer membrane protein TolC
MKKSILFIAFLFPFSSILFGQDSTRVLYLQDLFALIIEHHPMAQQANLYNEEAVALMRKARGNFDPKLEGDWSRKSFDGKNYFNVREAGMKLPTLLGVTFKADYTWTDGVFLNPERSLPDVGQAAVGLEWNVGRGLFIDEGRMERQQAQLAGGLATAQRRSELNRLLEKAVSIYWSWVLAHRQSLIFQKALDAARQRLDAVRESFLSGDKPAIDTLEATIQLQTREYDLSVARMNYQSIAFELSNFLWRDGRVATDWANQVRPPKTADIENFPLPARQTLIQSIGIGHPELRRYQLELSQLEIEEKWKREQLKPDLKLSYSFLGDGLNFNAYPEEPALSSLVSENYKFGISISHPLWLRKESASLQLTRIKMSRKQLGLENKRQELLAKINFLYNDWENQSQQLELLQELTANYRGMLDGELEKFRLGKSSLFLVNSREQKWIDSQVKLLQLEIKLQQTLYKILATAAILYES